MAFLKEILPITRLFQIVGISPFDLNPSTLQYHVKFSQTLRQTSLFLICVFVILIIHSLANTSYYINQQLAIVNRYMNILQVLAVQTIVLITLNESLVKRKHQIAIIKKINQVDVILTQKIRIKLTYEILYQKTRQQAFFWITENVFILTFILICGSLDQHYSILKMWTLICIPLFIYTTKYFQFTIYVNLVKKKLNILAILLTNMMIKEYHQWKFSRNRKQIVMEMDKMKIYQELVNNVII